MRLKENCAASQNFALNQEPLRDRDTNLRANTINQFIEARMYFANST
jgi:hypothetical protein